MDQFVNILAYISIISGGLLLILMLLSLLGGLDLDFDFGDSEIDAGGLGVVKSVLTFVSVAAWVGKIVIVSTQNTVAAIGAALLAGIVSVLILTVLLRLLLKNQKFIYWSADMAVGKSGRAYLRIPADGSGIVHVMIDESKRELKAKTSGKDIPTGAEVFIEDYRDGYLIVSELKSTN
jgi:hypothetical protein